MVCNHTYNKQIRICLVFYRNSNINMHVHGECDSYFTMPELECYHFVFLYLSNDGDLGCETSH